MGSTLAHAIIKADTGYQVLVCDRDSEKQGIAFGIVDYSSKEIAEMLRTGKVRDIRLMHADNMIGIR